MTEAQSGGAGAVMGRGAKTFQVKRRAGLRFTEAEIGKLMLMDARAAYGVPTMPRLAGEPMARDLTVKMVRDGIRKGFVAQKLARHLGINLGTIARFLKKEGTSTSQIRMELGYTPTGRLVPLPEVAT